MTILFFPLDVVWQESMADQTRWHASDGKYAYHTLFHYITETQELQVFGIVRLRL